MDKNAGGAKLGRKGKFKNGKKAKDGQSGSEWGNVEMEKKAGGKNWAKDENLETEKKAKVSQKWKCRNGKEGAGGQTWSRKGRCLSVP